LALTYGCNRREDENMNMTARNC